MNPKKKYCIYQVPFKRGTAWRRSLITTEAGRGKRNMGEVNVAVTSSLTLPPEGKKQTLETALLKVHTYL